MKAEKATPFDFDIELAWLEFRVINIFGPKIMEFQDMKDLFNDFRNDKALFAQFWDNIGYRVAMSGGDYD